MEAIFLFFMMIVFFGVFGCLIYKYRMSLKKWLRDPKYGSSWSPGRRTILSRKIEDAEAELQWLDENVATETNSETEEE